MKSLIGQVRLWHVLLGALAVILLGVVLKGGAIITAIRFASLALIITFLVVVVVRPSFFRPVFESSADSDQE